jgi:hypothetical protein
VSDRPQAAPAGWYDDPQNPGQQRWWDGSAWGPPQQAGVQPPSSTGSFEKVQLPLHGKGHTGVISVDDTFITIRRKGVMAKANYGFTRGEKRIPIDTVTAVQFKKPGVTVGYIQFTLGGGIENRRGVTGAMKDENSVGFTGAHKQEFEAIRDFIEMRIAQRSQPRSSVDASSTPPSSTTPSAGDRLRELGTLHDQGLISDEEYASQRERILSEM